MPKTRVGEIELYYEQNGEGEPLILIPGFAAGIWIWFRQTSVLAQNFQIITFDPRGVAQSDKPEGRQTIRLIADDVASLLRAIGIESAHVLGASFGGFVAQEFALAYPEMTRTLTLCCTSFGGPNHVSPSAETLLALASTKGLNSEERMRQNLLMAFTPEFIREHSDQVEEVVRLRTANRVPEHAYLSQLQAAIAFNAEERVGEIKATTLVISGDADVIVPVQNSYNLAARIPGAELVLLKGGSHTFFIEQANQFNLAVTKFITEGLGS
jgi:pimeloyl-ACP methyl ester carboxylesterase